MVYALTRYKTLSATQLMNIFSVVVHDLKLFSAFRLLCAYLYLEAKQEATERSLKQQGHAVSKWKGPNHAELRELIGGRQSINGLWQQLVDAGLVSLSGERILVTETPLPGTSPYLGLILGQDEFGNFRRSASRAVPIPHEWLLDWSSATRSKIVPLLHLFYSAACLSFKNKNSGDVKNAATFKFARLVDMTGLHRSRMTLARKELIDQKRISPDTTRYQRKLNRDGHYAQVLLDWHRELKEDSARESGRPADQNCTSTGRPYRDKKQALLVGRNQKRAGVFSKQNSSVPNPNNVQLNDLWDNERLQQLFRKQTWLKPSRANFLFFVAAAVKARSAGQHPAKLFTWLVRGKKCNYVSQAHEDAALKLLRKMSAELDTTTTQVPTISRMTDPTPKHSPATVAEQTEVRETVLAELAKLEAAGTFAA